MRAPSLFRPRSINAMVVTGYAAIMLPLLIALIWALVQLDRLSTRSEVLILDGIEATQNSRLLQERLRIMERLARQYQVSEDSELLEFLRADAATVNAVRSELLAQTTLSAARRRVNDIGLKVDGLLVGLTEENANTNAALAIDTFASAITDARELETVLNEDIDGQLKDLRSDAEQTRTALFWQAGILGGISLLTMLFVTWRVSRPIRLLDKAISQLGEGQFSRAIAVKGPRDLEALGHQLEWLRQRLLELAQEKNRFLRHMSHELKTPLANIREGTELLLDGSVGQLDDAQEEVTDILRSNGIRLQRLIENLLNFSAWQNRNEVLAASEFPVRNLIESVLKVHALPIRTQEIRLLTSVDETTINADREMIRTVLDNLLSNALKFSPKGGALLVRGTRQADSFTLEVADQGPGIPMAERKKVFDAFFQGKQQPGGLVAGTGIGLSVVLESVQAHDGFVDISDEQQAVRTKRGDTVVFTGAHFKIVIPQQPLGGTQQQKVANG
ncbi:MAG: HAMP domain-containing sensor histidine kinase [Pseudomonadota bacterium]